MNDLINWMIWIDYMSRLIWIGLIAIVCFALFVLHVAKSFARDRRKKKL